MHRRNCHECRTPNAAAAEPLRGRSVTAESGNWACAHCGNVNFASRLTCNMRICGAARPSRHAAARPAAADPKELAERLMRCRLLCHESHSRPKPKHSLSRSNRIVYCRGQCVAQLVDSLHKPPRCPMGGGRVFSVCVCVRVCVCVCVCVLVCVCVCVCV